MYITPYSYNSTFGCDCPQNKKSNPNFGMALILTREALKVSKKNLINSPKITTDEFIKTVTPLAKRATKSNVDVIVDVENGKLTAKVMDNGVENLGVDGGTTYTQESVENFDFIRKAVEDAEKLAKINKELKDIKITE